MFRIFAVTVALRPQAAVMAPMVAIIASPPIFPYTRPRLLTPRKYAFRTPSWFTHMVYRLYVNTAKNC